MRGRGRGRGRVEIWVPNFGFGGQRVGGFDGVHAACVFVSLFFFILLFCIVLYLKKWRGSRGEVRGLRDAPRPRPSPHPLSFTLLSFFVFFFFFF